MFSLFKLSNKNVAILSFISLMGITNIYGQLSIKEHTLVNLGSDLTSYESEHSINADINGNGKLIFNSDSTQKLTTCHQTILPYIIINTSTTFDFYTSAIINGDLKINSPYVAVHSLLFVRGKLNINPQSYILSRNNIIISTTWQKQIPFTSSNISLGAKSSVLSKRNTDQSFILYFKNEKTTYPFEVTTLSSIDLEIPTPPPKNNIFNYVA